MNTSIEIKKYLSIVDTIAEKILINVLGKEIKLPVDIDRISNMLGVHSEVKELPDSISGAIKIENDKASMVINQSHAPVRQRFTKAHEIGHLIAYILTKSKKDGFVDRGDFDDKLQSLIERNRDYNSSNGSDPEEIFANKFAAAILIPYSKISNFLEKNQSNDIALLADNFGVSKKAMEYRIKSLNK
ncbi:MAG: ImmA/IrrE family metallo-endopeptidase [Burkholderiales bacterium]|nr:ImmA/IrrE family metallo-endopeptidase [Burkholderiales bacterium]